MNASHLLSHFDRICEAEDAVDYLRQFTLDLAAHGKLVDHDSTGETAAELLEAIGEARDRLIEAGTIKNQEPVTSVDTHDKPFQLPSHWEWVRFGAIAEFSAGRTPSRHDTSFWNTGEYNWVSIADMTNGGTILSTKETVSEKAVTQLFRSAPPPIGTMIMSFKLTIGKISRLGIPAFHNEAIISIHPHLLELDSYLFKVLPQFAQQGATKDAIKGATLNRQSLANILIPLPPLAEQQRIVSKIDELMALCDLLEAAQSEREMWRSRFLEAVLHETLTPATGGM